MKPTESPGWRWAGGHLQARPPHPPYPALQRALPPNASPRTPCRTHNLFRKCPYGGFGGLGLERINPHPTPPTWIDPMDSGHEVSPLPFKYRHRFINCVDSGSEFS